MCRFLVIIAHEIVVFCPCGCMYNSDVFLSSEYEVSCSGAGAMSYVYMLKSVG